MRLKFSLRTHLCLLLYRAKVHSLSTVFFLGLSQASCMVRKTDAISAILLLKALISSPMLFSLICYLPFQLTPAPPSPQSSILSALTREQTRPDWFKASVDIRNALHLFPVIRGQEVRREVNISGSLLTGGHRDVRI